MAQKPEFVFIEAEGEEAERGQVLMAINEGVRAFLPHDFSASALVTYVDRAASGPGRLRTKASGPQHNEKAIAKLEETLGILRIRNSSFKKLVSYLLATPLSAQSRKVLVVSDSPYQLELLKKFLEEHNFTPLTAAHPTEGLAIALAERPRIVVSGMEFDGQTGIEFCQALKFTNKYVPCYFIICTSDKDKIAKVMVPGNGVDDCIVKPAGQSDQMDFVSRVALGLLV
jgi:CheY-like chemotaxis protein